MNSKKIIYISSQLGNGRSFGGGQFSYFYHDLLSSYKNIELTTFSISRKKIPNFKNFKSTENRIETIFANINGLSAGVTRNNLKDILKEIIEINPDLIWIDSSLLGKITQKIKKISPKIKILTVFHNVEQNLQIQKLKKLNLLWLPALYSNWINEYFSYKYSDHIISISQKDIDLLKKIYGERGCISKIPLSIKDSKPQSITNDQIHESEEYILFIGSKYSPNLEAIDFLAKKVSVKINIKILIIGRGLEFLKNKYKSYENIKVIGEVDNLAPYYKNALAVVAPIFSGGGMKVKVIEALMHGKLLIASNEALRGYEEYTTQLAIRRANTPEDYIKEINRLKNKDKYNTESRHIYAQHFSQDSIKINLDKLLKELI